MRRRWDEERVLLRRNYLLNQTGQAALGLIGPHLRGIAVEPRPDAIVLHFAITARTAEVEEDLDDIIFELEVFLGGGPEHVRRSQLRSMLVGQTLRGSGASTLCSTSRAGSRVTEAQGF